MALRCFCPAAVPITCPHDQRIGTADVRNQRSPDTAAASPPDLGLRARRLASLRCTAVNLPLALHHLRPWPTSYLVSSSSNASLRLAPPCLFSLKPGLHSDSVRLSYGRSDSRHFLEGARPGRHAGDGGAARRSADGRVCQHRRRCAFRFSSNRATKPERTHPSCGSGCASDHHAH